MDKHLITLISPKDIDDNGDFLGWKLLVTTLPVSYVCKHEAVHCVVSVVTFTK